MSQVGYSAMQLFVHASGFMGCVQEYVSIVPSLLSDIESSVAGISMFDYAHGFGRLIKNTGASGQ